MPSLPLPFNCAASSGDLDAAWIQVSGELDILTTPQLDQTLRESQARAQLVVLDLRDVTFLDCSGVHVISEASSRARKVVQHLLVLRAPPGVNRIFELTGTTGTSWTSL